MAGSSFEYSTIGANVFGGLVGPVGAAGVSGGGTPFPQFKPGQRAAGDCEGEFTYVTITLAAVTSFLPGQVYQFDKDFNATVLTTAAAVRGQGVGVVPFAQAAVAAGTYGMWLQTGGNGPVALTGAANAAGETTATAGTANFAAAPTAGAKTLRGLYSYGVSTTFTATTLTGSPVLTAPSNLNDLYVGAAVAGAGIPGATTVKAIDKKAQTVTLSANATASAAAVVVTVSGTTTGHIQRPYVDQTN
jgi:hypothetical protein